MTALHHDSQTAPRLWALIPCAGSGARAPGHEPKQYRLVAGVPLVCHTLAAFRAVPRIAGVLVVVSPGDRFFGEAPAGLWVHACGGATRAHSVGNGLRELRLRGAQAHDWVLVHDAARCLVTPALIDALIDACIDDPVGGLLALELADTLKQESAGRVAATVERAGKWLAQTPQMFRLEMLREALERCGPGVTDESSAIEALGHAPLLVGASAENFKVTYPQDFALAEAVLRRRQHGANRGQSEYDYP